MNIRNFLILVFCVTVLVCSIVFGMIPYIAHADVTYSGQEVYLTQEEFEQFKADLKTRIYSDNLKLEFFDVLASEPPIIVNFKVLVPYTYDMPYGTTSDKRDNIIVAVTMSVVLGILLSAIASVVWDHD